MWNKIKNNVVFISNDPSIKYGWEEKSERGVGLILDKNKWKFVLGQVSDKWKKMPYSDSVMTMMVYAPTSKISEKEFSNTLENDKY